MIRSCNCYKNEEFADSPALLHQQKLYGKGETVWTEKDSKNGGSPVGSCTVCGRTESNFGKK